MSAEQLPALTQQLLVLALLLALAFGALNQRSHFCVMGAISDVVTMGDWTRARMWALAVAVSMTGFAALQQLGWVQASQTLYGGTRLLWASHLVGGLLFGVGMVLASGCGAKTLVRAGAGNLKSAVVMLVMGMAALMTMKGLTAVWRQASVDAWVVTLPGGQDLSTISGFAGLGYGVAAVLAAWALAAPGVRRLWPLLGGLGTGALVLGAWVLSSRLAYLPEHPETLAPAWLATAFNRPESFSFVAPVASLLEGLLYFSDGRRDWSLGMVAVLGVMAGSAAVALLRREFRWEGFRQTEDLVQHLMGAVLMGVGGITALGCTIGQGVTGIGTLSLGSLLAVAGIIAGGVLGLRLQMWRLGA